MANLHRIQFARLFIMCISVSSSFTHETDAEAVSFHFPPSINIHIDQSADTFLGKDRIELTANHLNGRMKRGHGWATYNKLIPVWDNSSKALANFSTHFQFAISNINDNKLTGDGLTFFLAPSGLQFSDNTSGEWLGLFEAARDGNASNQIVAVEFDTFKNLPYDPDDNHVGIDFDGRKSKKTVSVYDLYNKTSLKNGEKWDAWVDYDGNKEKLEVFLLFNPNGTRASKPTRSVLCYDIDLRRFLPQNVQVGFSASSGNSIQTHTVYSWNFSCQYSWEISAPDVNISDPGPIRRKKSSANIILRSALPSFVAICCFFFAGRCCSMRTRKRKRGGVEESDEEFNKLLRDAAQSAQEFPYADIGAATNNFSDHEMIGVGGFGCVYRGTMPGTNEAVAIKRISPSSKQGKREYITEISINSKLTHHNVVKFLGWSHRKGDLLLVYELLANGSLDKYIYENPEAPLDWDRRYSIACDVASALVYLHEDRHESVLHRDIKASNVMLDSNFKAKLGDFGLARTVERENGGHTTTAAGTIGYIAPEFVATGMATREMDVFSFGALSLEIACGRRPADWSLIDHNCRVVEWVWQLHGQHRILDAADEKLGGSFNDHEMERLLKMGLLCSHPDPHSRPSMENVVGILKRGAELPHVPLKFPVAVYGDHDPPHTPSPSSFWTLNGIASTVISIPSKVNATV
ncbi:L-type lectin-domain containing receptor kinase IX.1-like [Cryptomeria japonica]|uniref:L-type lectin-domain containing receptor kinase IX.1-like n=1 Tax=Cryptomeria japonica TaxID=3369 RepID=UPI0027D9E63B|nr:L-type lectin-domain containing receptor kinase IX.1-like [Cryptomeria japonica]